MVKKLFPLLCALLCVFSQRSYSNIYSKSDNSSSHISQTNNSNYKYYNFVFKEKTVTYTGETFYHEPTNVPHNVTVKYDKNGFVNAGSYIVKAYFYNENNILISTKSARLNIDKARITGVTLRKKEVVYDGSKHSLEISGELPEGVTATYQNNSHTNAGVYKMSVRLARKNHITSTRSNTLTILPIDISSKYTLTSQMFVYDGQSKSIFLNQKLPSGLYISYKGNNQSEIGSHLVTATITGSKNYTPIPLELKATITITKEEVSEELPGIENITFENLTTPYTGSTISILANNLPDNVIVKYSKNDYREVGHYQIKASFYFKNILLGTKTAFLTIEKARITGVTFNKTSVLYNGEPHTLLLKGDLPNGVTAIYSNNKHTNAGTYKATVKLTGENYITSTRTNTLTITPIDLTQIIEFKSQTFKYDGIVRFLKITSPLPKELKVSYKNNGQNAIGNHQIEATITGSDNYTPMPYRVSATLSITKAQEELPSLDSVIFEHKTETYTGEVISIDATNLPNLVTVKYNQNEYINTGVYQVVASFYYKDILLGTKSATLTIEKARIIGVKFSKKEVTYDGKEHELLLEGELPLGVTVTYKNNIHKNAGTYKASVTLTGDNYISSTRSNELIILPADITQLVELKSESFIYDGKPKSLAITGEIPQELTLTYTNNTHTAIGNHTVTATLDDSDNYTPMPYTLSATLSITKKQEELPSLNNVIFEHKTETYTGEAISIEATNLPNNVRVSYDKNQYTDAGIYHVIASFYFKDILLGTKSATLTIEKARITGVKFSKKELTYDGKEHELLLEGELPLGVTATYKNNTGTNTGIYKASVKLEGDNYITSTRSNELIIFPADITQLVELKSQSFIYDGKPKSLTVTGEVPQELTLSYQNNKHTEIGNHTVTATLDGSSNYTPMPYTLSATLSITKKEEELPSLDKVIFEHKTETYTGETISIEATNLPNNVRVSYDKNQYTDAGIYHVIASFYFKDILLGTKSATLTIEKARITGVKFSKKEVTYDGKEHELLLEGELPLGVTVTYKNNIHKDAGTYKASVTLTGDNYITSTRSNELIILPADITQLVELKSESFIYDGKPKSLAFTGEIPQELTLTYQNNKHTEIGNYTVTATLSGSSNYTPMPYTLSATLSITKKQVELPSLDNVFFEHKTETYTGEVIAIEATNLPNNVRVSYDKNQYIDAGTYQVVASFYFKNILLGTKSATLTIEKARITGVKFSKKEVTYDGKEHELLLEGELPKGVIVTYKNNRATNAGTYKASVKLEGDNYITSTRSNELIILPADITQLVELKSESFIYDGKSKSLAISGEVPKELTLTYQNNKHTEIGNHTVTATLNGSDNYAPMPYTLSATLSITEEQEELPSLDSVIFGHKTETYTGEVISIEATNLPNLVTVKYSLNEYINTGVYQVIASFYFKDILLGTKSATLTIEKARITGVKFSKKEVTYDGKEHELLLEGELPLGVTATYKNNIHKDADTYKASVKLEGDNYITSTRSNELIILPADITQLVEFKSQSFIYDGKPKSLVVTGEVPQELTLTYANNTHTEVGNHIVTATFSGSSNYTPMPYTLSTTLSITKKQEELPSLDKVIFEHKTETYTGEAISIEATNLPNNVRVSYDKNQYIDSGTYQVVASFYFKDILLGTKSATLTIEKARITGVTLSKKEVTYDGNEHELLLEGELPLGVTATYKNNTGTNAGTYKASVKLEGDNYITSTRSNELIILPADITQLVELKSESFIYDGKSKSLIITGEVPQELTLTYTNNTHIEIGNYTVTATLSGSDNYAPIPYTLSATLSITQKEEELPSLNNVIFEHKTETYTGEVISIEATNLPNLVTVKYNLNEYINTGTYQVIASFYFKDILLGTKSATLTIEKARITGVKFSKKEVTYDGKEHELLLEGELPLGVTVTYKNNIHKNAGTYKASVKLEGDNYITSTRSNELIILPADITQLVELKSESFIYDGKSKSLIITGEVPQELTLTYTNNTHIEIGNYTVTATLSGSDNYAPIPYTLSATLSITKKQVELPSLEGIIFEHKTETYTGEAISIEATNLPNLVTVKYNQNEYINTGVYQVVASFYFKDILLGTKLATLTIEKARITGVTFSKKEVTYNGKEHELLLEGELPLGVTATYKNNIHKNVGTYKASVKLEGDNYITSTRSNELIILPADITQLVELKSESFIYDGKPKSLMISGEVPKELTLTYQNNKHTEIGNHKVTVTLSGSSNYTPMPYTLSATLSITKKQVELPSLEGVIFEHKTETYTGEIISIDATNLPNNIRVTYDKNQYTDAGIYQVIASFYFKDILLGTKSATLTIEKARITRVKFSKKEVTYNGQEHELLLEGELPLGVTATYKNNKATNAGIYKASVKLEGDNYITSTRSNELIILPADITQLVELKSQSFIYDDKPKSLAVTGEVPQELTLTYANNTHTAIGNHIVTATLSGSSNYTPMPYTLSATLSITQKEEELPSLEGVIFEHKTETYTGETISIEATNLPNNVRVSYDKNQYTNIGVYQVIASFYFKGILLGTKSTTLTIEKARITGVKFSKKEVIYDGQEHELLLEGELPLGVTATYKNNRATNAGTYKASVKLEGDNYITSTRSNELIILPADITQLVELKSQSFVYDGKPKSLAVTGEVPQELTLTYTNNTHTEVGNHTVTATLSGSSNYTPMPYRVSATLSITKVQEELPSLDKVIFEHKTETYTGEVISIEATNLPDLVTVKYNLNKYINTGTYQVVASFYFKDILLGTKSATLTIEKARITGVKFSKKEVTYDGKEHELLLEGELPLGITATYKNNIHKNAGTYKASVKLEGDNYITSTRSNELIILPADITQLVELKSKSFIYDGKPKSLIISGEVPQELTLTYTNNTHTEVGNHTVTATLSGSSNYTPMPYRVSATLSITKVQEELPSLDKVIFEHKTETYTGEVISIEATNLPDLVTVKYNLNKYINTGTYQVVASFYFKDILLGTKSATLTIEKARITGVKFSKKKVTYDGKEHELLLEGELPLGVTVTYKNNIHKNAGTYKASVKLEGDNYITSTRSNELIILPADITQLVELKSESFTYDGKPKSLAVTGEVPQELTLTYTNNTHTAIGNHTVTATLDGSSNYTPMPYSLSATLSITQKEEELPSLDNVIFEHKTETYTGEIISIEATNLPDLVTVKYNQNEYINTGVYQVVATFYFKDILLGTKSATLTIGKARITGVKFSKKEVTYDGKEHELLLEGELPLGVTATYKNNIHKNAGTYKASVKLEGDNYITSTRSNELVILPADITQLVKLKSKSFIYDGKPKSLVITGEVPQELTLTYQNNKHTEIGNHMVTAILSGSDNYTPIPYTLSATLSITEEQEELPTLDNIIFKDIVAIYSGQPYKIIATNLPQDVTVKYSDNSFTNSGVYIITADFYYQDILLGHKRATLTIEKAPITSVKFSKKEVNYTGTAHQLLLEGELPQGVKATYQNNKHIDAGEYKASVKLEGDNYITSTRTNLLIIRPADLTRLVSLKNQSFKYDGQPKSLNIEGHIPQGLRITYQNNTHTDIGHYTVTATLEGSSNYTPMPYTMTAILAISHEGETLPMLDNVIFENKSVTYNGNSHKLEAYNIPNEVNVEYDRNYYDNAGEYSIKASFYYKSILIGTKTAKLTIEKAKLTNITFSKLIVDYTGKPQKILIKGKLPKGVTATYENNIHTDAGIYKASVTLEGDNYITSKRTANLTIKPLDIHKFISFPNQAFVYDGQPKTLTLTGNLPHPLKVTYENNTHTEIGKYQVKATIEGSSNYAPMPYVITATLVIRSDDEAADIVELSINEQVFKNPTNKITYILPCGEKYARIEFNELSAGAFITNNIKEEYLLHYAGTFTIPVTVKSESQTLTREYTIELIRPVPFEKVAIMKPDNSFVINMNSATNGGFNFTSFNWYRDDMLVSTNNYYVAGAYSDINNNNQVQHHLILTTDKGEKVYTCKQIIEINNTNKVKLFPNPVNQNKIINIVFDMDRTTFSPARLEIYSILGNKVLEAELPNRENSVHLPPHLQSGKYIAVILINNEKKIINFIIK
ncbi:T9SS type A sorting domain-containing protein [Myroides sp.]|uniref:T9SS type A sorting domain-containing protein n=1 Tax=Myroides sp. TaxID=1874736 RepID=UPI0028AC112B|nr:T9SS type A sorting domain-containing protein [Myroides sp.]